MAARPSPRAVPVVVEPGFRFGGGNRGVGNRETGLHRIHCHRAHRHIYELSSGLLSSSSLGHRRIHAPTSPVRSLRIARLPTERARKIVHARRSAILMKKADELSILCSATVALFAFSPSGTPSSLIVILLQLRRSFQTSILRSGGDKAAGGY